MSSNAQVADLASERFERLFAARANAASKLADLDRRISAECARYSDTNGYKVRLTPEQIKRAMGAGL